jgi:hypothetical protein
VKQKITVVVSDQTGAKTITALRASQDRIPEAHVPSGSVAQPAGFQGSPPR